MKDAVRRASTSDRSEKIVDFCERIQCSSALNLDLTHQIENQAYNPKSHQRPRRHKLGRGRRLPDRIANNGKEKGDGECSVAVFVFLLVGLLFFTAPLAFAMGDIGGLCCMGLLRRARRALLGMLVLMRYRMRWLRLLALLRDRRRGLLGVLVLLLPFRGLRGVTRLVRRAYRLVDVLRLLLRPRPLLHDGRRFLRLSICPTL